jgi:hypothetical protein
MTCPAWRNSRAGTLSSRWRRGAQVGPAVAVAAVEAGQLLQPGGEVDGQQSAPHPYGVGRPAAEGRCRSAAPCFASRMRSSMSVRIRCRASAATARAGVDTSRLVAMNEYAYTCPIRPSHARAS